MVQAGDTVMLTTTVSQVWSFENLQKIREQFLN